MSTYFARQYREIQDDSALRIYGFILSLCHFLSYLAFSFREAPYNLFLSNQYYAICWPFFENCFRYRFLSADAVDVAFHFYGAACLFFCLFFLRRKYIPIAYWGLLALTMVKLAIYLQDFRLRGNHHYMLFVVCFAYLFIPFKRQTLKYLIVLLYFWSGLLKLNYEWLSGAAVGRGLFLLPDRWVPMASVYVVGLELVFVFGLLFRSRVVFWLALFQLALFHIASFGAVGFFYPCLMGLLLSIFVLDRFLPKAGCNPTVRELSPGLAYLLCFAALQMIPRLIPGDERLTGEGRLFGLHMFDARVDCKGAMIVRLKTGGIQSIPLPAHETVRVRCDPLVIWAHAKWLCFKWEASKDLLDIDVFLESKHHSEVKYSTIINIQNFCSQQIRYNLFQHNAWIQLNHG